MTHRRYLSMTAAAMAYALAGVARHAHPSQGTPVTIRDRPRAEELTVPRHCYADDPKARDTWRPRNRIRARARHR